MKINSMENAIMLAQVEKAFEIIKENGGENEFTLKQISKMHEAVTNLLIGYDIVIEVAEEE